MWIKINSKKKYIFWTKNCTIIQKGMKGGIKMGFKVPKGVEKVPKTIRIDESDCEIIEKLAYENKTSFNEIVNSMIKYAIENME